MHLEMPFHRELEDKGTSVNLIYIRTILWYWHNRLIDNSFQLKAAISVPTVHTSAIARMDWPAIKTMERALEAVMMGSWEPLMATEGRGVDMGAKSVRYSDITWQS